MWPSHVAECSQGPGDGENAHRMLGEAGVVYLQSSVK